ncbi:TatD family hydrolase [Hydrogenophaga sp. BPS33]|uniref:TatD family hydrolase n=1 Tax=Hydrogenophaga sp. BPS33 TaxID=2651974 RepID=UPI00132040F0|nr:TatD family hydrolase [Hydrogenophaga sp. BPS33]QHE87630.1 TatD family deoxyribonuclease [Hydrogenophaga sp. BPS33]
MWIDTHCHLDAPEFGADHALTFEARQRASERGVGLCVIPAVMRANFDTVRTLAHRLGDAYALGIHPLCVPQAGDDDLAALDAALTAHRDDPRLVAVGEIGLDFFVPALCTPEMRERQAFFYRAQLRLARRHGLPVIVHVRRSADHLLKHLRELPVAGIAHAFNGSEQQARSFLDMGFKLGFGGACTFDAARQLRRLAAGLPLSALVLETDAPDMAPQWLYVTVQARAGGRAQGINTPAELPRIGAVVADLRGSPVEELMRATTSNALAALPRLAALEAVS